MKILRLFNFLTQSDPSSPQDGDVWRNVGRLKLRIASVTQLFAFLTDIPAIKRTYQFSYMSVATTSVEPFGKDTTNSAGYPASSYPSTMASGGGLVDGFIDPYVVINNCNAKRIRIRLGQAAVQQVTAGASPVIRISLYKAGLSNARTLVGNFDIPLTVQSGTIGVNSTPNNVFATGISPDLTLGLLGGDAIGIEFTPLSANNNSIFSAGKMIAVLETEE